MARVLALSFVLHLAVGVALARLQVPPARRAVPIELTLAPAAPRAATARELSTGQSLTPPPPASSPPRALPSGTLSPAQPPRPLPSRTQPPRTLSSPALPPRPPAAPPAASPKTARASSPAPAPPTTPALTTRQSLIPDAPRATVAPAPSAATDALATAPLTTGQSITAPPRGAAEPQPPPGARPNLFAPSALAKAADIDVAPTAADRAWRPRRGVGGDSGAGGVDVGSFLAEDAARLRVQKGAVAPELRAAERRLDDGFAPTFTQADNSNKAQLFWKQFRGFLRDPPKTGALARALDPTKETLDEKLRSRRPDQAFFLGRRVEVFVRQKADGSIVEMALRSASGYRGFDDAALAAVEKALRGRIPGARDAKAAAARDGEVRTLWQLDATAYVVISPNPELVFDEASGKHEWVYPLQKRVDHHVHLVAVY